MGGIYGGIQRSGSSGSFSYTATKPHAPVNYVSFWDAARFANWLKTGDTETGVYNLGGVTNPVNSTITRDTTAWANGGVAIASENEWYKAAYYDPTKGGIGGFWKYPTQSNVAPSNQLVSPDHGNSANYYSHGFTDSDSRITKVGIFANSSSYYGTFDQGGNLWEWIDEAGDGLNRVVRGGELQWLRQFSAVIFPRPRVSAL